MNLKAIVIIMLISCTGSLTSLKGFNIYSIAVVKSIGVVVRESTEELMIRRVRRAVISVVAIIASKYSVRKKNLNSTVSPGKKIKFKIDVKIIIYKSIRRPLKKNFKGTLVNIRTRNKNKLLIPYAIKEFAINKRLIKKIRPRNFILGSNLCIIEFIG